MALSWDRWWFTTYTTYNDVWEEVMLWSSTGGPATYEEIGAQEYPFAAQGHVLEDGGRVSEQKYVEIYLDLVSGEKYDMMAWGIPEDSPPFFGWTNEPVEPELGDPDDLGWFWFDKRIKLPSEPFTLTTILYDQDETGHKLEPGWPQQSVTFGEEPWGEAWMYMLGAAFVLGGIIVFAP